MSKLGDNLKNIREKNKETQKELAKHLFISFQCVSKWEKGETTPDVYTLVKIAQHYNVSLNYLLGIDTENYNKKEKKVPLTRKERWTVIKAAYQTYLPILLGIVGCFLVAILLMYLWLK